MLLRSGLPDRRQLFEVAWRSSALALALAKSSAHKNPITGLAPFRRTALPLFTSPSTLILISTRSFRVVSPPAKGQLEPSRGLHQPLQEAVEPGSSATRPEGPNSRETLGIAAHRRHVTRPPASDISTQCLGWMQSLQKCVPLEKPIRSQDASNPFFGSKWLRRLRCSPQRRIFLPDGRSFAPPRAISTHDDSSLIVLLPSIFFLVPRLPGFASICRFQPVLSYSGQNSQPVQIRPFRGLTQHLQNLIWTPVANETHGSDCT